MEPHEIADEEPRTARVHKRLLVAVPALVLVGLIVYGFLAEGDRKAVPGDDAPEFELALLDGPGTLSSEDLRGSPVVVNFFASWCFPCREEAPLFAEMSRKYADDGVRFVGINVQGGLPPSLLDSTEGARDFVKEFGIEYPTVIDGDGDLAKELMSFYGLPQTFYIDHEWKIFGVASGEAVGNQGSGTVFGAVSRTELEGSIRAMIERADRQE